MNLYKSITYLVTPHLKDTGSISGYFTNRAAHFFLFIYPSTYKNAPCSLKKYENGKLLFEKEVWFYKGSNKILIYLMSYISFLYFLIFYRIRNTKIITTGFPFYCLSGLNRLFFNNQTVLWIWDYFPDKKGLMLIYHTILSFYNRYLKTVFYLSPTLFNIYNPIGFNHKKIREVISLGIQTDLKKSRNPQKKLLGFIGNIRGGQGIELVFDFLKENPDYLFEVIGDGPLKNQFIKLAEELDLKKQVHFYDFVDDSNLPEIVGRWQIAMALYGMGKNNVTDYTDPSKVKMYLQFNIPFVMTDVSYLALEVKNTSAGEVVQYTVESLTQGIFQIQSHYSFYENGIKELLKKYEYQSYYDQRMKCLRDLS